MVAGCALKSVRTKFLSYRVEKHTSSGAITVWNAVPVL
jgi:hypothetical protein